MFYKLKNKCIMREKNRIVKLLLNFIVLTLLIFTWNYSNEDISLGKPHGLVNQLSKSLHVRTSRLLRVNTEEELSPKYAFLRENIKQLLNEDGANFERKLITLLRYHNGNNNFSTLMKKDDAIRYTDSVQRRKACKKVPDSLKYHNNCNRTAEGYDLYDFYDDDNDNDYRNSEETFYDKGTSRGIHSFDDSKYHYARDRVYGARKNCESYRKRRHPSKYKNTHDKELYKSRNPYRGFECKNSRNRFFPSLFKFFKSIDTFYEKELMKMMTYSRTRTHAKNRSRKQKIYFNVLSPFLISSLLLIGSILLHYPVGIVSAFVIYFITVLYVLYKTVKVAKKCSSLDWIKDKRRCELIATRGKNYFYYIH